MTPREPGRVSLQVLRSPRIVDNDVEGYCAVNGVRAIASHGQHRQSNDGGVVVWFS